MQHCSSLQDLKLKSMKISMMKNQFHQKLRYKTKKMLVHHQGQNQPLMHLHLCFRILEDLGWLMILSLLVQKVNCKILLRYYIFESHLCICQYMTHQIINCKHFHMMSIVLNLSSCCIHIDMINKSNYSNQSSFHYCKFIYKYFYPK